MSKCDVELLLDPRNSFRAGEVIRGSVRLSAPQLVRTKGVTVELGWRVRGRGNPGSAVVQTVTLPSGQILGEEALSFELKAPNGPVSHRGELLEVSWFVRAQVDIDWAIDPKAEVPVTLLPAVDCREPYLHGSADPELGADSVRNARPTFGAATWVLAGFSLVGMILAVRGVQIREAGLILFGLVFIFIGTVGMVTGLRLFRRIAGAKLGEVKVQVEPLQPRAGDIVRVDIEVMAKPGARVDGARLILKGVERVVRGTGKNRRTTSHALHESAHELTGDFGPLIAGVTSRWTVGVPIPADAAPTFRETDNRVTWEMEVRLDLPGGLDWTDTITLGVQSRG